MPNRSGLILGHDGILVTDIERMTSLYKTFLDFTESWPRFIGQKSGFDK